MLHRVTAEAVKCPEAHLWHLDKTHYIPKYKMHFSLTLTPYVEHMYVSV